MRIAFSISRSSASSEVVGEAASQIPQEERGRHPEIPWSGITRFRNRMIHGYDFVNLDIVWAIANDDLPPLIAQLEAILSGGAEEATRD
jgi:uncharacterized protein with HEPN domain